MGLRDLFGFGRASDGPPPDANDVVGQVIRYQDLGKRAGEAEIPHITEAMRSSDWRAVRMAASDALGSVMQRTGAGLVIADVGDIASDARARRAAAAQAIGQDQYDRLVKSLSSGNALVRIAAAEMLGETGRPEAATAMVARLGDADWAVVSQLCDSLLALGARAVPALVEASADRSETVRSNADWCLQALSTDSDPNVRADVERAISGLRD